MDASAPKETPEASMWRWEPPSYRLFMKSFLQDGVRIARAYPVRTTLIVFSTLLIVYAYRQVWHEGLLFLRIYSGAIVPVVFILWLWTWLVRRVFPKEAVELLRHLGIFLGIGIVLLGFAYGRDVHTYISQYWRYLTITVASPAEDPTTGHERVWPLHGVHTYARQQMNETETPTKPNLVRIGSEYSWTMGVEPSTAMLQYLDPVEEVVVIPATDTTFDFKRSRDVHFETGEFLLFSRNIFTCVRRSLWLHQSVTYEPAGTLLHLKNDEGAWVQVVPMIKWTGYFFPRPERAGVVVIPQSGPHPWYRKWFYEAPKRVLLGCGTWIGPEEIKDHKYLVGQNIVPYEVTRYMAASLRFRAGFLAPMPWRKEGDLRISDLPEDVNQQPFTMHFTVRDKGTEVASKLFHYFSLEPEAKDKQGLSVSFLAPADGIGSSYTYWNIGRRESLIGVTQVAGWVRASKRTYDWTANVPVEHRPYIRYLKDTNGRIKPRWMWLTTIVTVDKQKREAGAPDFITGSPEIAITDARHKEVVWVGSDPEKWPEEIEAKLGHIWAKETD